MSRLALKLNPSAGELVFSIALSILLGFVAVLVIGFSVKYAIAMLLGLSGFVVLMLFPERRILSLVLWVLIHPLSIEKVFYVGAPAHSAFLPPAIVINASDIILFMLAGFIFFEELFCRAKNIYWPYVATPLFLLVIWSFCSYFINIIYFNNQQHASIVDLSTIVRVFVFMLLVHWSVKSRSDVVMIAVSLVVIILFESILVGLSYDAGEPFSINKLLGGEQALGLQTYSSASGEKMVRGVATLGHVNQQAVFHVLFTFPVILLFVFKSSFWKLVVLFSIVGSLITILLTFSRGAWLSAFLGILVAFFMMFKQGLIQRQAWLIMAVVAVALSIVLAVVAQPVYDRITSGDDGATDSRLRMIDLAVDLFIESPLVGVGPGQFAAASLNYYPTGYRKAEWIQPGGKATVPTVGRLEVVTFVPSGEVKGIKVPSSGAYKIPLPVHNKYLLTLSELGFIGLMIFLWFYYRACKASLSCYLSDDKFYQFLGVAGTASVVSALSYMNLDLFSDAKTLGILLFVPFFISSVLNVMKIEKINMNNILRDSHA